MACVEKSNHNTQDSEEDDDISLDLDDEFTVLLEQINQKSIVYSTAYDQISKKVGANTDINPIDNINPFEALSR